MGFTLSWKNRGTFVAGAKVEIFRYTSAPDVNNLTGSPIATINDMNVMSWVDTTCLLGATYYYVLRTTSGTRTSVSAPKMVTITEDLGPGPKTLIYGDRNFGFFGSVAAVNVLFGAASPTLYKFVYNGRIIYVDVTAATPASMLALGHLSGGVIPAGLTSGNGFAGETKALINSNGRLFRARASKLYPRDNSITSFGTKFPQDIEFGVSETLDLFKFLFNKVMTSWCGPCAPIANSITTGIMTSDSSGNSTIISLPTTTRVNASLSLGGLPVTSNSSYSVFRVFEYYGVNPADVPAY